jgi:hypothetical protein
MMESLRLTLLSILFFSLLVFSSVAASSSAGADGVPLYDPDIGITIVEGDHIVNVGMWVINVYDFSYKDGAYVFDFYIYFFWTDHNITTIDWYLMNGRPSTPTSKIMVSENKTNHTWYEIYRVRADLSIPLEPKNYPFDKVPLPITFEILEHGYSIELNWMVDQSGVDPGFKIVGWNVVSVEYLVVPHQYPLNITLQQGVMNVVVQRDFTIALSTVIIPPLIFCAVSAFSFLFRMDDFSAFGLRVGLNTSMLITAVLFNLSVTNNIPPIAQLNFYMVFTVSVLAFLAINLIITILGYVTWNYQKDAEKVKKINRYGIIISIAIPVLLFLLIFIN